MAAPPEGGAALPGSDEGLPNLLLSLPPEVARQVLAKVFDHQSPAALLRVSLVCKELRAAVATHDVWERAAMDVWGRTGDCDLQALSRGLDGVGRQGSDGQEAWFDIFQRRMQIRWQVRRLHRTVTKFQSRLSQLALQPGVDPPVLAKAEARLGYPLPLEVWESFRFRNGQEDTSGAGGGAVGFADGARLLMLHEVLQEFRELNNPGAGGDGAQGDGGVLIPLTASQSPWARECFAADLQGRIYYVKGFSRVLKAPSWSHFLKSLLR